MTNQEHPIEPPTELVQRWRAAASNIPASSCSDPGGRRDYIDYIANQAAQWSWDQHRGATESELQQAADQELEACIEWLHCYVPRYCEWSANFRVARRPKPPSLKEQALRELGDIYNDEKINGHAYNTIRQALEALPND